MTTHINLCRSEIVLKGAIKRLKPEHQVDLQGAPRGRWDAILKKNLRVETSDGTSILNIAYRSEDPDVAVGVLDAIVSAYIDFVNPIVDNRTTELHDILATEMSKIEEDLRTKAENLRATGLAEAVKKAREKRLEAESLRDRIERAIKDGDDLHEYATEMVEDLLPLLPRGNEDYLPRLRKRLQEDVAELEVVMRYYGPAHHKVMEIQERIRVGEQYDQYLAQHYEQHLAQHSANVKSRIQGLTDEELASALRQIARRALEQATANEEAVAQKYQQAKDDVDRLRAYYTLVQQRIKEVDLHANTPMLRVSVISQPEVAAARPRLGIVASFTVVFGLLGGLGMVTIANFVGRSHSQASAVVSPDETPEGPCLDEGEHAQAA
jgi:uncharacterized protein involved in exopolysaccharide biosynthesis